jgi:uncharacterized protein (TIGR03118 family)
MSNFHSVSLKPLTVGFSFLMLSSVVLAQHYQQNNLVSNVPGRAQLTDPNLVNSWGLVHGSGTPWWVADNGTGKSTLYSTMNGMTQIVPLVVNIPAPKGQKGSGTPIGIVFNGNPKEFLIAAGKQALFIFVTEDGTIAAWNPGVDMTNAVIVKDNSSAGAVYKGVTIGEIGEKHYLFVTNFRSGKVEVYDTYFHRVPISEELFDDDQLPQGFAPFNIQGIGPNIYVTYAKQDAAKHDDVHGPGLGYVDVFSPQGTLLQRLQHGLWFNGPWGVTLAPADFGEFSHALLIGNFGGHTIAAFNSVTGRFIGNMRNPNGTTLNIDGLWALDFGNGNKAGPANTLFFTAGPDDETNGVFGTLTPVNAELNADDEQ